MKVRVPANVFRSFYNKMDLNAIVYSGKITYLVTINGGEYCLSGAVGDGRSGWASMKAYKAVPLTAYSGEKKPLLYHEHFYEVNHGTRERSYDALLLKYKNQPYVLVGPQITIVSEHEFEEDKTSVQKCEQRTQWCTDKDVKLCRWRSKLNVYDGQTIWICKECRKAQNGSFKFEKQPALSAVKPHEKQSYRETFGLALPGAGAIVSISQMAGLQYYICWLDCPDGENILYAHLNTKKAAEDIALEHGWKIQLNLFEQKQHPSEKAEEELSVQPKKDRPKSTFKKPKKTHRMEFRYDDDFKLLLDNLRNKFPILKDETNTGIIEHCCYAFNLLNSVE